MRNDIVGYDYRAAHYCEPCMVQVAMNELMYTFEHDIVFDKWATDVLELWARELGIADSTDMHSFDSDTFPKPVLGQELHDACRLGNGYAPGQCADMCESCHEPLGEDCPHTLTDPQDATVAFLDREGHETIPESATVITVTWYDGRFLARFRRTDSGWQDVDTCEVYPNADHALGEGLR